MPNVARSTAFEAALSLSVVVQLRAFSFAKGGLVAAQEMHAALLGAVVQAPLSFFNRTRPGRVLNRHARAVFLPSLHSLTLAFPFFYLLCTLQAKDKGFASRPLLSWRGGSR